MDQETIEKKNILLVGEDAECATLIERTLGELGLKSGFRAVSNCPNALTQLRKSRRHDSWLILLNLEMPERGAWALLESLKVDPVFRMIPIVVLAAGADAATITTCYDLGAAGYLIKTGTEPDFLEKIRRACGYWLLSRAPMMSVN